MSFRVPDLGYNYDALGTYISADIMKLHHDKHHQAYVDKLNAALDKAPELKDRTIEALITNLDAVPDDIRTTVRNHGGGHYNHTLFWQFLSPNGGGEPTGALDEAIKEKYGSYQAFVDKFTESALGVFGSGWAWLQPDLTIVTTPNQDSPIMTGDPAPLLGLDVWEHAYYLDYTYNRADYVKAWWNVANWECAARRYAEKPAAPAA